VCWFESSESLEHGHPKGKAITTMKLHSRKALISLVVPCLLFAASALAEVARDPGPRSSGANDPPRPLDGLTSGQAALFNAGATEFGGTEAVKDGLGPTFNLDSCGSCHAQPTLGGTSPAKNPQFIFWSNNLKKTNRLPPFITANGPTREVRFKRTQNGTVDGGVHDLFTITGLAGAEGCNIDQPRFFPRRNIIFRIPTPTLGAGLIEQIPDQNIVNKGTASGRAYGIKYRFNVVNAGHVITGAGISAGTNRKPDTNVSANDGTIARFGWKAQNKSLLVFSGEAYNVEMGITNELFQTERNETAACQKAPTPNDTTNPDASGLDVLSDIEKFAAFMRFLAPPVASTDEPGGASSIGSGKQLFRRVGCAACHTPMLHTGNSAVAALDNKEVNLYSDLAIHDMGAGLADGISQGLATGTDFRTAPLWGLGQRLFFLHDGRTSDLVQTIREHRSPGSEANRVVRRYFGLRSREQQDLLNFLRSL
jgi:CxxC motif-containing protein (DUF1111 family)